MSRRNNMSTAWYESITLVDDYDEEIDVEITIDIDPADPSVGQDRAVVDLVSALDQDGEEVPEDLVSANWESILIQIEKRDRDARTDSAGEQS